MIFTTNDLRYLIIKNTLDYLGDWSLAAENLLIETAVQASGLGDWSQGRRLGIYCITPVMCRSIWDNYLIKYPNHASEVRGPARTTQLSKVASP